MCLLSMNMLSVEIPFSSVASVEIDRLPVLGTVLPVIGFIMFTFGSVVSGVMGTGTLYFAVADVVYCVASLFVTVSVIS